MDIPFFVLHYLSFFPQNRFRYSSSSQPIYDGKNNFREKLFENCEIVNKFQYFLRTFKKCMPETILYLRKLKNYSNLLKMFYIEICVY